MIKCDIYIYILLSHFLNFPHFQKKTTLTELAKNGKYAITQPQFGIYIYIYIAG